MHFHAQVATVDDDDVVEIMDDLPSYSCRSTDASSPTDEDCWSPKRILDSLDHIVADCKAHPGKYPKGFLKKHRDLIEGVRQVAAAARENDALVLTVVG